MRHHAAATITGADNRQHNISKQQFPPRFKHRLAAMETPNSIAAKVLDLLTELYFMIQSLHREHTWGMVFARALAAMYMSRSVMRVAPHATAASPIPGKMYALFPCRAV